MSDADYPQGMTDQAQEAIGVYIGPATQAEVIADIVNHRVSPKYVLYLHAFDGGVVWLSPKIATLRMRYWQQDRDDDNYGARTEDDGDRDVVLVFGRTDESVAGNPLVVVDAPLVLAFSEASHHADALVAERWSGGVRIHLGFGPDAGHVLTIVFWHGVLHLTEDGDVAPGFGGFSADISEGDVPQ